jgi:hypothetical protein
VLLAVEAFKELVDICFKSFQGLTTIIFEQNYLLHSLVSSLRALLDIEGPPSPTSVSIKRNSGVDSNILGAEFATTRSSFADFIAGLGFLALSCRGKFEPEEAKAAEVGIGTTLPASVEKISAIRAKRNSSNGPSSERLPSVLPHELAKVTPRQFNDMLLEQSQRLRCSGQGVDELECEFRSFKVAVQS